MRPTSAKVGAYGGRLCQNHLFKVAHVCARSDPNLGEIDSKSVTRPQRINAASVAGQGQYEQIPGTDPMQVTDRPGDDAYGDW